METNDLLLSVDYSQVELRVLAWYMARRKEKWAAILQSPGYMRYYNLRKSRARAMVEAIATRRVQEKGNLRIRFITVNVVDGGKPTGETRNLLAFYYRGNQIASWYPETGEFISVDCGEFEDTPSTRNQRKMITEAIKEFNEAVFGL